MHETLSTTFHAIWFGDDDYGFFDTGARHAALRRR